MHVHYCEHFDGKVFSPSLPLQQGVLYAGNDRLLAWIEAQLGLQVEQQNTDYLRIELYRQALLERITSSSTNEQPFYAASFEADPWAVAQTLLAWRDELLLSGWDFSADADCPPRLAELAQAEVLFSTKLKALAHDGRILGTADRWARALAWLQRRPITLSQFSSYEPEKLWLPHIRRLIALLNRWGVKVNTHIVTTPKATPGTDLAHWQAHLCGLCVDSKPATADGSVRLLRVRRDSDAALFLASWLAQAPDFRPLLVLSSKGDLLEQALLQHGLPALGVPSASLARPSLQTLKLAAVFLWDPPDVFKIMEFLTQPLKPFDDGLALEIARVLADKPGLFSDTWFATVNEYLDRPTTSPAARQQYEFWFFRKRYPADGTAPVTDAAELYDYLYRWAVERSSYIQHSGLLTLAEQARRVRDVLQLLPDARISRLALERIVRTIHEPVPLALCKAQQGALPFVQHPGAVAAPVKAVCWWNCANDLVGPPPDPWRKEERQWLSQRQIILPEPDLSTQRHLFFLRQPILQCTQQVILFLPEQIGGEDAQNSLLINNLESIFNNPELLFSQVDADSERNREEAWPELVRLRPKTLPRPGTHLNILQPGCLGEPICQTPTEVEQLLYFPHRWFFRHKIHLYPSSLLSIARDQQLLGKLAHRFFELLLKEPDCLKWEREEVVQWVLKKAPGLLAREGATLLLYGREPERHYLLSRVQTAAWSLLEMLRSEGWDIYGTEVPLEGLFCNCLLRGRADLVLQRADNEWAIVDLKWSGLSKRRAQIRNNEDLQLTLYSYLLPPNEIWAHTAYFIIEEARMVARNRKAFRQAFVPPGGEDDHVEACQRIFQRMQETYQWRKEQFAHGLIELRYEENVDALNEYYGIQPLDKLEMKRVEYRDEYYMLVWGGI
ncbi:MAG: PD-(D/E)XK nuclease family protein [Saprospiraceae bacterium]|nr:PD-(D/E)XK nuclease family protein [Saprospiraceae bacterium]MDW8484628.1 PD-(D/E)XK nuclease family protein [Saprospiraceae bacterium]